MKYVIYLPKGWKKNQKVEKQKKIITILYLIASIKNMQVNRFELGIYLNTYTDFLKFKV